MTEPLAPAGQAPIPLCIIPGDGIGPEVVQCARTVLDALAQLPDGPRFLFDTQDAGMAAWAKHGDSLPEATLAAARKARATLLGALDVAALPAEEKEPLTRLRRALNVSASVRPALSLPGAAQSIDTLVVREVTEGFYNGTEFLVSPDAGCAIRSITRSASERAAQVAFAEAAKRRGHVVAVHKQGIFKITDRIFLDACESVAAQYPTVAFSTMNVDACAYDMVRHPGVSVSTLTSSQCMARPPILRARASRTRSPPSWPPPCCCVISGLVPMPQPSNRPSSASWRRARG